MSRPVVWACLLFAAGSLSAQNVSISVDALPPGPQAAGATIAFTVFANNEGPDSAANTVLTFQAPAATTFVSRSQPAGWSCSTPATGTAGATVTCTNASFGPGSDTFVISVATDPSLAPQTLQATATITTTSNDPDPNDNALTILVPIESHADLEVTKEASPNPVTAGTTLTYTIRVINHGPSFASNATLTDPLPSGVTFLSLTAPAGWTCTTPVAGAGGTVSCSHSSMPVITALFTLSVRVDATLSSGTAIANAASVDTASSDSVQPNDSATAAVVSTTSADLAIGKSGPATTFVGGAVQYTLTVTNGGPSVATNVVVTDALPASLRFVSVSAPGWFCTAPAAGASGIVQCSQSPLSVTSTAPIVINATVDPSTPQASVINNTATITSTTPDPNSANDSAATTATVATGSLLTATKTATGGTSLRTQVIYTIVVTNGGLGNQGDNPGDEFVDPLPAGLLLESATATSGTVIADVPNNRVLWNGSLASGASVTITIVARVVAAVPGTIVNQGTLSYDANGDGTNERTGTTNAATINPTAAEDAPAASPLALVFLGVALASAALIALRR